ncbi:FHA domain-containing protein [Aetokthonos hydrillicola Thurmond2011]|jgi:hypothetical protein|uniref:FHA domain-containing protein n=1 Tax=Aetokthonos hydrillicola Thurmond2011 TaxID=2712845 RepID=A0AAP5I248_9CYAN|nr:FHA domain-containing protein [Aetokthonos hydrillicola]MBO3462959.1 FHA domain-containing protein [Aetokthonos hydrillicola CCALA 1050]MBW4591255.1 FHA domain-containing protein [Aetokthonos hydrillicola CCALA 1050]MDR9893305.1 FHA domain-containing protein [Aetokthonos hydrillicola Thurmond2011]
MKTIITIKINNADSLANFYLFEHYLIGSDKQKCQEILLSFSSPVELIILEHPKISGFHCTLYKDNLGYLIIDGWSKYKSRNGIYVNGKKTECKFLTNNDVIFLGCSEITLQYKEELSENEIPEY